MSTTDTVQEVFQNTDAKSDQSLPQPNKAVKIYVRLVFLRIGEIDTLNEKYQAQASIEAQWPVSFDKLPSNLSSDDQKRLANGKSVSLQNYAESHWHPQLYIENGLGDLKEQIKYSAKTRKEDNEIYICEHRDIKGLFWEKLELQHFPSDVQDLSISIASMLYDDKVLLIPDPYRFSGVNRETFVDQQEWSLYEHVNTEQRFINEFLVQTDDDDEEEDEDEDMAGSEERKRSVLTVTCHAARQSKYFYWNGYCLIFLIAMVSLYIFAIPPHMAANRIQISCTLLLTSITFRWTVNRSLPTVSYLTSMDRYGLLCIFNLVFYCIWHAIIGLIAFLYTKDYRVSSDTWIAKLDHTVFYAAVTSFIFFNTGFLLWLCCVPFKHRKKMQENDVQYRKLMSEQKKGKNNQSFKQQPKRSSSYLRIPVEK